MKVLRILRDWLKRLFRKPIVVLPPVVVEVDWTNRQCFTVGGHPKVRYRNIEMANAGRKRMEARSGRKFDAYRCGLCDGFHIGGTKKRGAA